MSSATFMFEPLEAPVVHDEPDHVRVQQAQDVLERARMEAESIREMIVAGVDRHGLDASRIFVTGLSAGGAMTSVRGSSSRTSKVAATNRFNSQPPISSRNHVPVPWRRTTGSNRWPPRRFATSAVV